MQSKLIDQILKLKLDDDNGSNKIEIQKLQQQLDEDKSKSSE
jgi:hypothetical protein